MFRGNKLQGNLPTPTYTHTEIGSERAFMFAAGIRILLGLKLHVKHISYPQSFQSPLFRYLYLHTTVNVMTYRIFSTYSTTITPGCIDVGVSLEREKEK